MVDPPSGEDSLPTTNFRAPTIGPYRSDGLEMKRKTTEEYLNKNDDNGGNLEPGDAHAINGSLEGWSRPGSSGNDIYLGSYRRPKSIGNLSHDTRTPQLSRPSSIRGSQSQLHLEHLLQELDINQETYGVEELRDGFFDALFFSTKPVQSADILQGIDRKFAQNQGLSASLRTLVVEQLDNVNKFLRRITMTRAGIKLTKSFLAFFIAYIICLIPRCRDWLGRYNFVLVLSAILNHPGRPIGAQLDGTVLTILGTLAGLGWGSLALYVSTVTAPARAGYGGILATFLIIFTAVIAYLRCTLIRFYQSVICAGIAICYMCLANTSDTISWSKLFDYGIPWVLGQALCLVICTVVFPDAGSRALVVSFHRSMVELHNALHFPRPDDPTMRRRLAATFVDLSVTIRDFTIDLSIAKFRPEDVRDLRNIIQAIIRSTMAVEPSRTLFDVDNQNTALDTAALAIAEPLVAPIKTVILTIQHVLENADVILLNISGYRNHIKPIESPVEDLLTTSNRLRGALSSFDEADVAVLGSDKLPSTYVDDPELVGVIMFVHSIRQVASNVEAFAAKILQMQSSCKNLRVNLPSYPFAKALARTNAQVRHDRGGLTVGFYFRSKAQLERTMQDLQSRTYIPLPEQHFNGVNERDFTKDPGHVRKEERAYMESRRSNMPLKTTIRYRLWLTLHNLQGFETRFAFKVVLVTTLFSIPAWLPQSETWWNRNESWWGVVIVWLMMHPRVGGNFQDLMTRVLTSILGTVWGGLGYAADNGNPYVMALFAALFMIPMMYRFTQSSHPRSGLAGCISFTVASLSGAWDTDHHLDGILHITWTRGVAFAAGISAAIVVNWIIWPFVARHELRKSVSTMLLHLAILYRGVVAKYVYYTNEEGPTPADIERSEMLEGRLREAFVRIRQLLDLTYHEIRLRGPFSPTPYLALINTCESFFDDLIKIRQFSLYFQPIMLQAPVSENAALLSYRRDAVASILMNMYVLAGALKSTRPVPRYLPSAAAARKRLLDRMAEVHEERERDVDGGGEGRRRWADVYQYAYSRALTDIVEQLEVLQRIVKNITGEVGFDMAE